MQSQSNAGGRRRLLFLVSGSVSVVIGLIGSSFGSAWSPQVYDFLFGFEILRFIDGFTPYFPFVPLYPLLAMMLGASLVVRSRG